MRISKIIVTVIVSMLFCACDDVPKTSLLQIDAKVETATKAARNNFEVGDQIGLFVQKDQGGNYNDCDCSFNTKAILGTKWEVKENINLTTSGIVCGYYPYNANVTDLTAIPIESESQTDYLFSDKISVSGANASANLTMKHALSLMTFAISKESYIGEGKITNVEITDVPLTGTMNCTTGTVTKANSKASLCLAVTGNLPATVQVISIPTELNGQTALFTIDGKLYSFPLQGNLVSGMKSSYSLTINTTTSKLMEIGDSSLQPWGVAGNYNGELISKY